MPNRRLSITNSNPTERLFSLFEDVTLLDQIIKHKAHLPDGRRPPFNAEALTRVHESFTDAIISANGVCKKSSVGAIKKRYEHLRELYDKASLSNDPDLGHQTQSFMADIIRQQTEYEAQQNAKSNTLTHQVDRDTPHPHHLVDSPTLQNNLSPEKTNSLSDHKTLQTSTLNPENNTQQNQLQLHSSSPRPREPHPEEQLRLRKKSRTDFPPVENGLHSPEDVNLTSGQLNPDNDLIYRLALNAQKVTLAATENEKRRARLEADRMKLEALRMERDEAEREERLKMLESWKEVEIARVQAETRREEHRAKLEMERLKTREAEKKAERTELERLVKDRERAEVAIDGWRAEVERLKWEGERLNNGSRQNGDRRYGWRDRSRYRPSTPRRRNSPRPWERRPATPARPATPGPSNTPARPETPRRPATPGWTVRDSPDPPPEAGRVQRERADIPRDSHDI